MYKRPFVPATSHVLRAVVVYVRTQLGEKGYRAAEKLFEDADGCRTVLRMLGARPSLRTVPEIVAVRKGVSHGRCKDWGERGGEGRRLERRHLGDDHHVLRPGERPRRLGLESAEVCISYPVCAVDLGSLNSVHPGWLINARDAALR